MTRILVLNGPNLATLGDREPAVYGSDTLADIEASLRKRAAELGVEIRCEQSNSEGGLIDIIEGQRGGSAACVINPGGLSHTSVALADALRAFPGPVVEVHISNVFAREAFRHVLVTASAADSVIIGLGAHGYVVGLEAAVRLVEEKAQ